ncbi:MAG: vanadium-dependent haloperoxidase, partial [Gemmatimonadales bacterium]
MWLGTLGVLVLMGCTEDPATSSAGSAAESFTAETSPLAWAAPGKRADLLGAVTTWNDHIAEFGQRALVPPPVEARMAAMANTTVHDVLNAVKRRYAGYAYAGSVSEPLLVEAAIATGAHDVLASVGGLDPSSSAPEFIDDAYATYMAALPNGVEKSRGVALGRAAAAAMLAKRANDGSNAPLAGPYVSTGEPGKFRPLIPPTNTGLAGITPLQFWGNVQPFVLTSSSQFRAPPPYGAPTVQAAVQTPQYLADYAEVKAVGGAVSSVRTADQSDIAFFWVGSSIYGWNEAARVIGLQRQLGAWKLARLLAQVHLAQADSYIATFDNKYHDHFWRPVTAIRLGNLDPATPGDPTWNVTSSAVAAIGGTPPVPEYSSAHAGAGGASGAVIMGNVPGKIAFSMTSPTSQTGKPRSWRSVDEAIRENSDSRVYVGFHFRHATEIGEAQGRAVGAYVLANSLAKLDDE